MSSSPAPTALPLWDEGRRGWVTAVAAAVGALVAIGEADYHPVAVSLLPLAALGFVAKARWPNAPNAVFAVPGAIVPFTVNLVDAEFEFSMFLLALAVILLAALEPNRAVVTGSVCLSIGLIFAGSVVGVYGWGWPNWVAALLLSWGAGSALFHYDRVLQELRATQAELVDQATLVERRRIARDVHDLIGHSLSVIMLHIGGARRLIRTDPGEAEAALVQAEEAGRASMAEVRRTVGLMRHDDGDGVGPAPTLADVALLVDQYREAGLPIEYHTVGPLDGLDGPAAVACHRIVQEALANVAKHTTGAAVELTLEVTDERCRLLVRDRGGRPTDTARRAPGTGHGLTGMRERALSAGGSLAVGPADGGWSVDAVFPRVDPTVGR